MNSSNIGAGATEATTIIPFSDLENSAQRNEQSIPSSPALSGQLGNVPVEHTTTRSADSSRVRINSFSQAESLKASAGGGSASMMGRIEQTVPPTSQFQSLLEVRAERTVHAQAEEAIARLMPFVTLLSDMQSLEARESSSHNMGDPKSMGLFYDQDLKARPIPPGTVIADDVKEEARQASTAFFEAVTHFYGPTILNHLCSEEEQGRLINEGTPLTIAQVRIILTKADAIVGEIRTAFEGLPQDASTPETRSEIARSMAIANDAQRDLAAARQIAAQLNASWQPTMTALGRASMLPVGVGVPLFVATSVAIPGLPHVLSAVIVGLPALVTPIGLFTADRESQLNHEQIVARFPETVRVGRVILPGAGGLTGIIGVAPVIASLIGHGSLASTFGVAGGLKVLCGSLVLCPVVGAVWFGGLGGCAAMAYHARYFSPLEPLRQQTAAVAEANQNVATATERDSQAAARVAALQGNQPNNTEGREGTTAAPLPQDLPLLETRPTTVVNTTKTIYGKTRVRL